MPGSFILKPIEANLTRNTELLFKMNPYCHFIHGDTKLKSQVCKKGGKHPHWDDSVTINTNEMINPKLIVEIMDKDLFSDDIIGMCDINLKEIESEVKTSRWYPLFYKQHPAGELLIETIFKPEIIPGMEIESEKVLLKTEELLAKHDENILHSKPVEVIAETDKMIIEEPVVSNVFTEQHQVVEPHTFMKEVDVVETIPVTKEIEVMEPRKVIKQVEYTEAVPVMKTIEVVEPEVVMKEVEVIEPRVVTKTIEVIENVPVKRMVEVVEMKTQIKEVETFEPQTFKKEIEVTEQVPVKKIVEVSEPITVTKDVEFVEPIITTQTITKEVIEPVVVGEKITTTVGPATIMENVVVEKKMSDEKIINKKFE